MSENDRPAIITTRGGFRLVHQRRDPKAWPNVSDLTLERLDMDAMGESHWVRVNSWCLSSVAAHDLNNGKETHIVALKLLLDTGPVVKP